MKKILYTTTVLAMGVGSHLVWAQEDDDFFNSIIEEHTIPNQKIERDQGKAMLSRRGAQFKKEDQEELEKFFEAARLQDTQASQVDPKHEKSTSLTPVTQKTEEEHVFTQKEKDQKNWKKILAVLNKTSSVYDHVDEKDDKKIKNILYDVKELDIYFPCSDASSARGKTFYKHFESLCNSFDLSLGTCKTFLMEDGENFCRSIPNLQYYPEIMEQEVARCQKGIHTLVHPKGMQKLKNFLHGVRNKSKTQ